MLQRQYMILANINICVTVQGGLKSGEIQAMI